MEHEVVECHCRSVGLGNCSQLLVGGVRQECLAVFGGLEGECGVDADGLVISEGGVGHFVEAGDD